MNMLGLITVEQAIAILNSQQGRFVGITWAKKDGTITKRSVKVQVGKYEQPENPTRTGLNREQWLDRGYLQVRDPRAEAQAKVANTAKQQFRVVRLAGIQSIRVQGVEFIVAQPAEAI